MTPSYAATQPTPFVTSCAPQSISPPTVSCCLNEPRPPVKGMNSCPRLDQMYGAGFCVMGTLECELASEASPKSASGSSGLIKSTSAVFANTEATIKKQTQHKTNFRIP